MKLIDYIVSKTSSVLTLLRFKSNVKSSKVELKKETNHKRLKRSKIQRVTDLHGKYRPNNKKQGVSIYSPITANIIANSK